MNISAITSQATGAPRWLVRILLAPAWVLGVAIGILAALVLFAVRPTKARGLMRRFTRRWQRVQTDLRLEAIHLRAQR